MGSPWMSFAWNFFGVPTAMEKLVSFESLDASSGAQDFTAVWTNLGLIFKH